MGSNPKGNAFILNINKTVGRKDREGSDVDVISLEKLFKSLGYIIQSEIDLTYNVNTLIYNLFYYFLFFCKILMFKIIFVANNRCY